MLVVMTHLSAQCMSVMKMKMRRRMTGDEDDSGDDDDVTAGTRGSRFGIRTPALKYLL